MKTVATLSKNILRMVSYFIYTVNKIMSHFSQGMATVVNKIISRQKTITEDIAKFDKSKYQTADTMSQWRSRLKEQQRLKQLLGDLVTGVRSACW